MNNNNNNKFVVRQLNRDNDFSRVTSAESCKLTFLSTMLVYTRIVSVQVFRTLRPSRLLNRKFDFPYSTIYPTNISMTPQRLRRIFVAESSLDSVPYTVRILSLRRVTRERDMSREIVDSLFSICLCMQHCTFVYAFQNRPHGLRKKDANFYDALE